MDWTLYFICSYIFLGFLTVGLLVDISLNKEDSQLVKSFKRHPYGTIIGLLAAWAFWPVIFIAHKNI
jgi:hypothetical protein